jgi:uncharacterized protein YbcI
VSENARIETPGETLTAISTKLVGLFREHHGRGPMRSKTYAYDDLVVCVLRDTGLTRLERTLVAAGREDHVLELREEIHAAVEPQARRIVEAQTGRRVLGVLHAAAIDPDVTLEAFVMSGPGLRATDLL